MRIRLMLDGCVVLAIMLSIRRQTVQSDGRLQVYIATQRRWLYFLALACCFDESEHVIVARRKAKAWLAQRGLQRRVLIGSAYYQGL